MTLNTLVIQHEYSINEQLTAGAVLLSFYKCFIHADTIYEGLLAKIGSFLDHIAPMYQSVFIVLLFEEFTVSGVFFQKFS